MQFSPSIPPPARVSVGVPVYNGERYLARTLDALLAQTYRDFELIISDNASTDDTESICRAYAARDPRIAYHRAELNEGVARNFNRCFALARGTYFKWQAADDSCEPTFLEKCAAVLDSDPAAALVYTRSRIIDEDDQTIRINDYDADAPAEDPRAHVRFGRMINLDHRRHCAQEIYGLIRSDALRRTPLYQRFVRTDSILLARLALLGRFRCIDEPLLLNREHRQRSIRLVPGQGAASRSRLSKWIGYGPVPPAEFWDPSLAGKIVFPEWRILLEYARSMKFAPRDPAQWMRCRMTLAGFALRHTPKLARDLLIAFEHLLLGMPGAARAKPQSCLAADEAL